MDMLKI